MDLQTAGVLSGMILFAKRLVLKRTSPGNTVPGLANVGESVH